MGKKLLTTPRGRVVVALRQVWLRSRERAAAIKREGGCCQVCGSKQSKAKGKEVKLEVHHNNGIQWTAIIDKIYREVLVNPEHLTVLCKDCHDETHKTGEL